MNLKDLQIGPCTLTDAVEIFELLTKQIDDRGESILENTTLLYETIQSRITSIQGKGNPQHIKRELIKAFFEDYDLLPPLDVLLDINEFKNETGSSEAMKVPYNPHGIQEGGVESIAVYLPKVAHNERYGIYLHVFRILKLSLCSGLNPAREIVPVLCVHELFHHYTEKNVEQSYYLSHTHRPCVWEEAAANRAAVEWLETESNFPSDRIDLIKKIIMPVLTEGGLPGYGEWPLIQKDYPVVIPLAITQGTCKNSLAPIDWLKTVIQIIKYPKQNSSSILINGMNVWKGLIYRFFHEQKWLVPVYLDFVPLGQ